MGEKGKGKVADVGRAGRQKVKRRAEAQSKEAHLKNTTKIGRCRELQTGRKQAKVESQKKKKMQDEFSANKPSLILLAVTEGLFESRVQNGHMWSELQVTQLSYEPLKTGTEAEVVPDIHYI
jgi:hypothetical protein